MTSTEKKGSEKEVVDPQALETSLTSLAWVAAVVAKSRRNK
jgi:hypothetical protein